MADEREGLPDEHERDVPGGDEAEEVEGEAVLDEDLDGDEGDGNDAEAAAGDEGEPEARQGRVGRQGESRWQRRERELADLRAQVRQLSEQRQAPAPQPQPDPQAEARAEAEFIERLRMSGADPVDVANQIIQRREQRYSAALMQMEGRNIERADKADWRASLGSNPARGRLADQVEAMASQLRSAGDYRTTREMIFWTLYGQEMERRRGQAAPRQQRAAQRRVASQTTRPGSGRGEIAREGRRPAEDSVEAARARLAGQPLW